MEHKEFRTKLISHIENLLAKKVVATSTPPQGMTSQVFFIKLDNGAEYAVKYGEDAMNDVPALKLIGEKKVDIPIPKLIGHFVFEEVPVIVLQKISFPLLDSIPVAQMARYIPSMVRTLQSLHQVKSDSPRLLMEPESTKTWKQMLLATFEGETFDWQEVASRVGVDKDLILHSVDKIISRINKAELPNSDFALLHTDFNQRNLFVDPDRDVITGVIDWEEAMFGDPIFDFARVRMYIWHFNLGPAVENAYYAQLNYSPAERERDHLYWLFRVVQYLGWYSEELNEFNTGRIKLHQAFLREYDW